MYKDVAFRSLCQCLTVEKTLKFLYEEKEQMIRSYFSCLVGDLIWNVIKSSFRVDFDYDDDVYLIFNCNSRYAKDVGKKLKEVFGASFDYGGGDNYIEFQIRAEYILNMEEVKK